MYAGEQRTDGGAPLPHPAACRPTATAAAAGILLLTTLAGIRPDAPAGTVTLRPVRSAPLGEIVLTGLRVAGAPSPSGSADSDSRWSRRRPKAYNWAPDLA